MVSKLPDLSGSAKVSRNETTHNVEFAKGGNTPMFPEQAAEPRTPGTTRDQTAADSAPGEKFAKGGSGKMFGFQGSQPARDGITSAR